MIDKTSIGMRHGKYWCQVTIKNTASRIV